MTGDEQRARAAGCDGYLSKPIDVARLLDAIEQVTSDWPVAKAAKAV
jgi:CheY-like chemotaxis protein